KTTTLKAPIAKVWHAISDSAAFGTWFGMALDGPFVEGKTVTGAIAKTQVDYAIAQHQEPYVGMPCELRTERIVPFALLSFRWHPGAGHALGPGAPMTRVTFDPEQVSEGTRLPITDFRFEALCLERRAKPFVDNEGGWEAQLALVA